MLKKSLHLNIIFFVRFLKNVNMREKKNCDTEVNSESFKQLQIEITNAAPWL